MFFLKRADTIAIRSNAGRRPYACRHHNRKGKAAGSSGKADHRTGGSPAGNPTHNRLELLLDGAKRGDRVVQAKNGTALLLIRPELAQRLSGIMLDYRETARGSDFIIARYACR